MPVSFHDVTLAPLRGFSAEAPDGALVGVIGENGSGKSALLRLAAGIDRPASGEVRATQPSRLIGIADPLDFSAVRTLLLEHALARQDALVRSRAAVELDTLRRSGTTILLVSHEEELLRSLADEIWWIDAGKLAGKGDPREMLDAWRRHVADRFRKWGEGRAAVLAPSLRRGDGRAELIGIETLGENGRPAMTLRSGELAVVRVKVRYKDAVPDPVVGIMIRTRIGFEVYGTNTELERVKLGPCAAGDVLRIDYGFRCELCPNEYTVTAASHDPDGVWHDWAEDAIAFVVTNSRYTAGVANLRASVNVERD